MRIPKNLSYSEDHVWVAKKGKNRVRIGATEFLLSKLDSVDKIEVEEEGNEVQAGDIIGELISGEDSTEILSPVSGRIVKVNFELLQDPQLITESPYSDGWIVEIEVNKDELKSLLTPAEYKKFIKELDEK